MFGLRSVGRRVGRLLRDLRFRSSRVRLRVPAALAAVIVVVFSAFIVGGGLYDIVDQPPSIYELPTLPGRFFAVRGLTNEQTLLESILSMVLILLTFIGLYTSYKSAHVIYDSRRATTMLILGIILIAVGLLGNFYLLSLKRAVYNLVRY